jgi:hypothetical protein
MATDTMRTELDDAERKAWDSLARYKFVMFAYHAAWWVKINRMGDFKRANPFLPLVKFARQYITPTDEKGRQPT